MDDPRGTGFSRSSPRQTDQAMADMINRATENAAKQNVTSPRVLDEAPGEERREAAARPRPSREGRVLPWFLQDDDVDRS